MRFVSTTIPDAFIIEPHVIEDGRGFFMETWHRKKFLEIGIDTNFKQNNHSKTSKGIIRGLHYQIQQTQGKLVQVIKGEIFDVIVDLRYSQPSFGKWISVILSEENRKMLWVPEGFAHGFYVLSETAEIFYYCTDYYAKKYERTLLWNDPAVGIEWPLFDDKQPSLSEKDSKGSLLKNAHIFS